VKQHLAVLRMLFDRLVTSLIMNVNPGHSYTPGTAMLATVDSSLQANVSKYSRGGSLGYQSKKLCPTAN